MQAWIAGLQDQNPDADASYDPVGSGGGREQFNAGGVDFAGTDSPFADEELAAAQKRCGGPDKFVQVPAYISPIAVIYNVEGVSDLQLSPETIASIFKGDITNWNDAAIKKDNPSASLPDLRIVPVNRSDDSGTSHNFEDYLSKTAAGVWTYPPDDAWPVKGGEAAEGTSGVVDAVKNGKGTIGYADASQAGDLGIAKVKVGSEYVAPSPEGAAKTLAASKQKKLGPHAFEYEVKRDSIDPTTYPIILASYQVACTTYDSADTGKLVNALESYIISDAGQKAAADAAGSAPLTPELISEFEPSVKAIGGGS
jgi:phosphate transport system substrate-binding protein